MGDYRIQLKPEDIFIREGVTEYSVAVEVFTAGFGRYEKVISLSQEYKFRDDLEQIDIIRFVYEHWFLIPILLECPGQVKRWFGEDVVLNLELFSDPEDEDGFELFIVIRSKFDINESLRRFDQLLEHWFNSVHHKTKGLLNITVESKDEF